MSLLTEPKRGIVPHDSIDCQPLLDIQAIAFRFLAIPIVHHVVGLEFAVRRGRYEQCDCLDRGSCAFGGAESGFSPSAPSAMNGRQPSSCKSRLDPANRVLNLETKLMDVVW